VSLVRSNLLLDWFDMNSIIGETCLKFMLDLFDMNSLIGEHMLKVLWRCLVGRNSL
jgi:hypothetical protein